MLRKEREDLQRELTEMKEQLFTEQKKNEINFKSHND
jgi:hypothetical protein